MYNDYSEIHTQEDIDNLLEEVMGFHDGRIEKIEKTGDALYVLFSDLWGCKLELWFEGDLEYDVSSRDPEYYDPYWLDGTLLIQDGFIYLIDAENAKVEDLPKDYAYFKARQMKYHVIPN